MLIHSSPAHRHLATIVLQDAGCTIVHREGREGGREGGMKGWREGEGSGCHGNPRGAHVTSKPSRRGRLGGRRTASLLPFSYNEQSIIYHHCSVKNMYVCLFLCIYYTKKIVFCCIFCNGGKKIPLLWTSALQRPHELKSILYISFTDTRSCDIPPYKPSVWFF